MTQANLSVLVGIQPMHETMINLKEAWKIIECKVLKDKKY